MAERPNRVNGGLLDFPRSVDDMVQRFWGGLQPAGERLFRPAVDVLETSDAFSIRIEIPGIDPGDVEVTLTGDVLTIRGEKRADEAGEGQNWTLRERTAGAFERVFKLPHQVSADEIEADAKNGVLAVRVPKAKDALPRKISVRAG